MQNKLKCIMLIDDNRHDNFFHERVIRKADATEQVIVFTRANDALQHLKTLPFVSPNYPELIFLDINMPGMNGWDFLREFNEIPNAKRATVVVMLTTSNNPDDEKRAQYSGAVDFRSKPLTKEILKEIISRIGENSPKNRDT